MTGSDRHNNENHPDTDKIMDQFPAEERDEVRSIWDKSRFAKPTYTEISDQEVEEELTNLHHRLDSDRQAPAKVNNRSTLVEWRWMAAAAAVLLIFAAGILFVPKEVNVPYAETTTIDLPDGSQVTLNSGSTMQYSRLYSLLNREIELNGEAFFNVQEGELPFVVKANESVVRVTGTQFNVRSWESDPGKETEVTVTEGVVKFYAEDQEERSVTLQAGQFSRWNQGLKTPSEPDSISLDRMLGWKTQIFAFNKKPLAVILRELERRFDTEIKLEASSYSIEDVTVYYVNPKNVEVILKDICRVKGLRYSQSATGYRIYP